MIKNVVAYCRFSSDKQSDSHTIETQQLAIRNYCTENGYNIIRFYADLAKSGKEVEHRIQFLNMINEVTQGGIDAVIVYTKDRFSRSIKDFVKYLRIMEDHHCKLISVVAAEDNDTPIGELSNWINMSVADYYIQNLSREVLRGLRYNAKNGIWNTIAPLGYDIDYKTGRLVINKKEAEIVRLIFDLYLKGYKQDEICKELNRLGYKTKKGEPFSKRVRCYLINRRYVGEYIYHIRSKGRNEEYIIKGGVPQIIDDETFEAVQQKCLSHRPRGLVYKKKSILEGLVYCGETGYKYTHRANRTNNLGVEETYYQCVDEMDKPNRRVRKFDGATLDDLIHFIVEDILLSHQNISKLYNFSKTYYNQLEKKINQDLKKLEKQYAKKQVQLSEQINKIASNNYQDVEELLNKINNDRTEIIEIENERSVLLIRIADFKQVSFNELSTRLSLLRKEFEANRAKVIKKIIFKVVIFDDEIKIIINMNNLLFNNSVENDMSYISVDRQSINELLDRFCSKKVTFEEMNIRRYFETL